MEKESINEFVNKQVNLTWEKKKQPLLLSYLGILINKEYPSEKPNEKSLKEFIDSYDIKSIKYVYHKHQKAKIGLIPSDKNFSWETVEPKKVELVNSIKLNDFLDLMKSKLTDEEIDQIPTSILLKLFN